MGTLKCNLVPAAGFFLASFLMMCAPDPGRELEQLLQEHSSVGLSVGVVKDGDLVYSNAFGKKEIEKDLPLQTGDLFRIASISKSFSATAIMQFVEEGRISLTDDVSDLIGFRVRNPHYPDEVITLRMLLSHTSSISDKSGYFTLDTINPNTNPDWQESYNNYRPGTRYEYCNLAFNMVGTVIEKLSGIRFDRYIKKQILDPLGLYGGYNVNELDPVRLAPLYRYDSDAGEFILSPDAYAPRKEEIDNYIMGYSTPVFSPTGGMKLSAEDLARYMTVHMNYGEAGGKRIISSESARLMQTPVNKEAGYGLALRVFEQVLPGRTMIGHTGNAYGLYSVMIFDPREKFGFVAITNGGRSGEVNGVNHLLYDAVEILYREFIE